MALIKALSYLAAAELRPTQAAPSGRAFRQTAAESAGASIILPRPQATRALPFLAQYIAQELIGSSEPEPRWRDRETAYRAAAAGPDTALLAIDA